MGIWLNRTSNVSLKLVVKFIEADNNHSSIRHQKKSPHIEELEAVGTPVKGVRL